MKWVIYFNYVMGRYGTVVFKVSRTCVSMFVGRKT